MKSLNLLAEKYDEVQLKRSDETLVSAQTPGQLLEAFQELSQISGDVIAAFEHAITNRSNLIKENTAEQDSDVRVAVLAMEKVLSHLDESKDEQFCLAFETFAKNASLEEADLAVLSEAKGGFFSKLGKGIKKYAGKAAKAVGRGVGAAAKGAGQLAGGLAGGVVGTGKSFAQGAKQGYNTAKGVTEPQASRVATNNVPGQNLSPATKASTAPTTPVAAASAPVAPTTAAPAAAKPAPQAAAPTAPAAAKPAPQAAPSRIGAPAARQAVDTAVNTVSTMRADRRDKVIDYAIQKLTALKKGAVAPVVQAATPTNAAPAQAAAESLVAESVESFYITTNRHFRK